MIPKFLLFFHLVSRISTSSMTKLTMGRPISCLKTKIIVLDIRSTRNVVKLVNNGQVGSLYEIVKASNVVGYLARSTWTKKSE